MVFSIQVGFYHITKSSVFRVSEQIAAIFGLGVRNNENVLKEEEK